MKRLNKKRIIIAILIILLLAAGAVTAVVILNQKPKNDDKQDVVQVENEISKYGYVLLENETELYKTYFEELKTILNEETVDEEKYASSVVKLFIADFYDLKNKTTKNDVGGLQFVFDKIHDNFLVNAKDTIYKYVENNLSGDRTQSLPEVSSVTIDSVEKTTFKYNAEEITDEEAYKVKATWEYKEDLGYQKEATLVLMHQDKKLVIVELK